MDIYDIFRMGGIKHKKDLSKDIVIIDNEPSQTQEKKRRHINIPDAEIYNRFNQHVEEYYETSDIQAASRSARKERRNFGEASQDSRQYSQSIQETSERGYQSASERFI